MGQAGKSNSRPARAASLLCTGLAALLGAGCLAQHEAPSASDTTTNWLRSCQRVSDCAGANACVKGVCTLPCRSEDENACQSVHPEARCVALGVGAACNLPTGCVAQPTQPTIDAVCDLGCSSNAQCAAFRSGYVCTNGTCRADAGRMDAGPGAPLIDASGLVPDAATPIADAGWLADASTAFDASDANWLSDASTGFDASARDARGSYDPGCTTTEEPITEYPTHESLATYFARKWIPCFARLYIHDEWEGLEFLSDGQGYDLSYVNGAYVRKGTGWRWEFSPSSQTLTVNGLIMSAPRITPFVNSAVIGVDPTYPRFVPLRE